MKNLLSIPPLRGSGELYQLLYLLSNESLFRERLETIEKVTSTANEAISTLGKAKDIKVLHAKAQADRKQAEANLQKSKIEAAKFVDDTKEDRDRDV